MTDQDMPNTVGEAAQHWQQMAQPRDMTAFWAGQKAHALARQDEEPAPSPTRTSRIVARWAIGLVVGGIIIGMVAAGRAAENPPRAWIVWDVDADKPWTSAKGNQATATGPTACNLSLHEASIASRKGTRLACRRIGR